jgi:hypothetical protein
LRLLSSLILPSLLDASYRPILIDVFAGILPLEEEELLMQRQGRQKIGSSARGRNLL